MSKNIKYCTYRVNTCQHAYVAVTKKWTANRAKVEDRAAVVIRTFWPKNKYTIKPWRFKTRYAAEEFLDRIADENEWPVIEVRKRPYIM